MSRLWGFIPLACWLVQAIRYRDAPANLLWMCHVAALLLSLGVFTRIAIVVRIAAVWSIVGVPLWLIDVVANGAHPASILSHVAVPIVGFFALREHRGPALPIAAYALTLFVIVQQLCRMLTLPALNINVAHAPYAVTMTYPAYWALTTSALAALLALVAFASTKIPRVAAPAAAAAKPQAKPADEPRAELGFNKAPKTAPPGLAEPPRSDPGFNVPPKMSPSEWRAAVAAGKASPIAVPLAEPPVPRAPEPPRAPDALPRTKTRGGLVVDRNKPIDNKVPDEVLPPKRR
jgi:hypothetical protein